MKGPDLEAMVRLRTAVHKEGAGDAVILSPDGYLADGTTTCLAWWRGDALVIPDDAIERIDSVTLRSVLALATATGVDILRESARPEDLDGCEVWALNALHGIRIVTSWIDGPTRRRRTRSARDLAPAARRPATAPPRGDRHVDVIGAWGLSCQLEASCCGFSTRSAASIPSRARCSQAWGCSWRRRF